MQTSLRRIANKARLNKKYRFRNLYQLLNEDFLKSVFHTLNKKAASGVDKVSMSDYEENLGQNVTVLVEKLKRKSYRAKLVRRKNIPKGKGKVRSLGIPAVEDKLLQTAVSQILAAIFEQDFSTNSFGYRPGTGARQAVETLNGRLQFGRFTYAVEADIKGFFDNIDHEWLIRMVEQRVDDQSLIRIIRKWLKAGILEEDGTVSHPEAGTPQGGSVSPVLANIYLHYALDNWFEKVVTRHCDGQAMIIRYADDFVCMFQLSRDAGKFYRVLPKRLGKFNLEVAEDKTNLMKFNRFHSKGGNRFEFLGFEFFWGTSRKGKPMVRSITSKKKLRSALTTFNEWCKKNRSLGTRTIFSIVNAKLRGHYNYYGVRCNYKRLRLFYERAMIILRKWMNRRSQKRSCNWKKFLKWLQIYRIERPRIVNIPSRPE